MCSLRDGLGMLGEPYDVNMGQSSTAWNVKLRREFVQKLMVIQRGV